MATRIICLALGHKWSRHRYPAAAPGEDQPEGAYLKCLRCGKVRETVDGIALGHGFEPGA